MAPCEPRFDVTVAGELNLDLILDGLPESLPTERELLARKMTLTLGSSSAILAHNLAVLGSRVGFASRIGGDPLGEIALEKLAAAGAEVSQVRRAAGSTTGLTVILSRPGPRHILTYPGAMFEMCFEDLDLNYLADARHFHVSSFYLHRALLPRLSEIFERMKRSGLTTSLDTNDDPEGRWNSGLERTLPFVNILFLNAHEAVKTARADSLDKALGKLSGQVPTVVVKAGPEGAVARQGDKEFRSRPPAVETVDAVGAGDSFDAGFLHQYVRGAGIETCLAYGNLAGALSTTRTGGTEAFRDRAHVVKFFQEHSACGPSADGGQPLPSVAAKR